MPKEFNWFDQDQSDIVIPSVQAVAVYLNASLDVVIRQQDATGNDEDAVVIIPRSQAKALAKAILEAAKPLPKSQSSNT